MNQFIDLSNLHLHTTGFVHHDDFQLHAPNNFTHPECPERTKTIDQTVLATTKVDPLTGFDICSKEDILLVHSESYFNLVESQFDDTGKDCKYYFGDAYMNRSSAKVARLCVSGVMRAIDNVLEGKWDNAFCSVRPPGHHSGHVPEPNGFCIYNNIAIGARYAQKKHAVKKVLIFDWDVHHCDGTEAIFFNDPNVLVISIHRYDQGKFYPGSGTPDRIGIGNGAHFNINVGWNVSKEQKPGLQEYIYAYDRVLGPIIQEFKPELVLISAGYDSAKGDPLGGINNTEEGYQYITEQLMQTCSKVVAVLEGGYNIEVTANCVLATIQSLCKLTDVSSLYYRKAQPNEVGLQSVQQTIQKHVFFWRVLEQDLLVQLEKVGMSEYIAGGHTQAFNIQGESIIKKAKPSEVEFYLNISDKNSPYYEENQKILPLVPEILEANAGSNLLIMKNLLFGLNNASILDIKIGFKTYDPNCAASKREKDLKKLMRSGQKVMGFRVVGVKLRDKSGKLSFDKSSTLAYSQFNTKEAVRGLIIDVLKSNEVEQINRAALDQCIDVVTAVANVAKQSQRYFRSTSILLIVDNIAKKHVTKWIDFTYVRPLNEDTDEPNNDYDKNLHGGLISLLEILRSIKNDQ